MEIVLYDQEEVFRSYVECEKHDDKIEAAKRCLKLGKLSVEEVATCSGLTMEDEELAVFLLT